MINESRIGKNVGRSGKNSSYLKKLKKSTKNLRTDGLWDQNRTQSLANKMHEFHYCDGSK